MRHHICLTMEVKHDIAVQLTFLGDLNGRAFFLPEKWETSSSLQLYTDAAGCKGNGAIFGKHWFRAAWPDSWKSLNIAFLELLLIVTVLHIWGRYMVNRCGILH